MSVITSAYAFIFDSFVVLGSFSFISCFFVLLFIFLYLILSRSLHVLITRVDVYLHTHTHTHTQTLLEIVRST